ncbi:MAG: flagellar protein FliS [Rhodothermales bacterium]|jgi:flagellar protein FliS
MSTQNRFSSYQAQAVMSASPEQLIVKLYDLGISACHREDRFKVRAVLRELISSLDMDKGGELAGRLYALYAFCMDHSSSEELEVIADLLSGLREVWKSSVVGSTRAA